jgi:hypothetical protein
VTAVPAVNAACDHVSVMKNAALKKPPEYGNSGAG